MEMNLLLRIRHRIYVTSPEWGKWILRRAYWKVWFARLNLRVKFGMLRRGTEDGRTREIVCVNPTEIRYWSLVDNSKYKNICTVEGGDWDLKRTPIEDMDIFIALREHFENGVPLSKSKAHDRILKQIEAGVSKWGCQTEEELNARWKGLDELHADIKAKGYQTQRERGNPNLLDEVTVKIGRDGELLFEDGRHRLSIAKILGLKSIPVVITKRHREWAEFKAKLLSYSRQHRIYQPLLHPDLTNIPSSKGDERVSLILENLPIDKGEVLDIGANWGYFCHVLEDAGFHCYAVENSLEALYFLTKLRSVQRKKFDIVATSVFDIEKLSYDVVLALNIFHHFLKNEGDYHRLTEFLGKLDIRFMFFEPHKSNEPHMTNAYANYDEVQFVEYILSSSCLNTYTFLGRLEEDGRGLYLLKR